MNTVIGGRRAIVCFVLCGTAFGAPRGNNPERFYIVAEAHSDAAPFWFGYILDVRPDGDDLRVRWIRIAQLNSWCSAPMTVSLAERRLKHKKAADLPRSVNPCKVSKSEVERVYRKRQAPDLMDHPVGFGIVADCADGEKTIHLPQFAWSQERKLRSRANRVWRLRNLYWDVVEASFGETRPFWDISDEEDFKLQLDAEPAVNELRSGAFDSGLMPCQDPACVRTWAAIIEDYRGPVRDADFSPKAQLRSQDLRPTGVRFVEFTPPAYPPLARQARIQGTVRLVLAYSRESGEIIEVSATEGHGLLIPAAVEAARNWKVDINSVSAEDIAVSLEFSLGCP